MIEIVEEAVIEAVLNVLAAVVTVEQILVQLAAAIEIVQAAVIETATEQETKNLLNNPKFLSGYSQFYKNIKANNFIKTI